MTNTKIVDFNRKTAGTLALMLTLVSQLQVGPTNCGRRWLPDRRACCPRPRCAARVSFDTVHPTSWREPARAAIFLQSASATWIDEARRCLLSLYRVESRLRALKHIVDQTWLLRLLRWFSGGAVDQQKWKSWYLPNVR